MTKQLDEMPALRAFVRREVCAQIAINLATSLEEALEIIRAANRMAAGGGHPNAPGSV